MVNSPPVQWYFEFCIFPDPPADIHFSQTLGSSSTHSVQDNNCLQWERKAGAVLTASSQDPEFRLGFPPVPGSRLRQWPMAP